jgi:lantibiotic biosynthesis protein
MRKNKKNKALAKSARAARSSQARRKVPETCFYLKLYLPVEESEGMLQQIAPIVSEFVPGVFPTFFFVRYADPDYHLRLRFFGERVKVLGKTRHAVLDRLRPLASERNAKLLVGRYRPELRRYGGPDGVRVAERVFWASSRSILEYLALRSALQGVGKTEFALVSGEVLLDAMGMDFAAREAFFRRRRKKGALPAFEQPGAAQAFGAIVERIGKDPLGYWGPKHPLRPVLERLHEGVSAHRMAIAKAARGKGMTFQSLADSYLHMHLNRLAISPKQEGLLRHWRGHIRDVEQAGA